MDDIRLYFSLGWDHIMNTGAADHILFIIALTAIYTLKEWRRVLILVTAFTIGHSITLALASLNVIHLHVNLVEFLIPCTIIITSLFNLFQRTEDDSLIKLNYVFAATFGMIHGLGFASGLRSLLGKGEDIFIPLLGFNLGLETGQIVIVLFILLVSQLIMMVLKVPRSLWIIILSALVFSLALKMAIERLPFF